eukprot:Opistho-1_new@44371
MRACRTSLVGGAFRVRLPFLVVLGRRCVLCVVIPRLTRLSARAGLCSDALRHHRAASCWRIAFPSQRLLPSGASLGGYGGRPCTPPVRRPTGIWSRALRIRRWMRLRSATMRRRLRDAVGVGSSLPALRPRRVSAGRPVCRRSPVTFGRVSDRPVRWLRRSRVSLRRLGRVRRGLWRCGLLRLRRGACGCPSPGRRVHGPLWGCLHDRCRRWGRLEGRGFVQHEVVVAVASMVERLVEKLPRGAVERARWLRGQRLHSLHVAPVVRRSVGGVVHPDDRVCGNRRGKARGLDVPLGDRLGAARSKDVRDWQRVLGGAREVHFEVVCGLPCHFAARKSAAGAEERAWDERLDGQVLFLFLPTSGECGVRRLRPVIHMGCSHGCCRVEVVDPRRLRCRDGLRRCSAVLARHAPLHKAAPHGCRSLELYLRQRPRRILCDE